MLDWAVHQLVLAVEIMGIIVIVNGALKTFWAYIRKKEELRLEFAQHMAMALEFKLAGEILRTVIVRQWDEIAIVGAIILLRGVLNFLIQRDIAHEEQRRQRSKQNSL